MKAYLQLTAAQLRIFARNRQVMFWTLFFPIFFMVMLGSFLGNDAGMSLSGSIIDEDGSQASKQLVKAFTGLDNVKITETSDKQSALKSLNQGDSDLVIVIPKGYGERLPVTTAGGQSAKAEAANAQTSAAQIITYYDQTNKLKSSFALLAVNQIVDGVSKQWVHYQPAVTVEEKGVQSLNLKYIDFLVPGIVAMMIMSNNLNGVAGQIASWRERGILRRMQSTTLNASTFIAAQITARLLMNGLQAFIVLLVGNLIFGTQVNGSWLLLLFFVVLGTLAFMSIGFIIAGLAKNPESAGPIAGFISFPLLFLGGIFFPINNMPAFLQPIVKALPISHLTTALRQVMNVGAGWTELWNQAALLGGWMVVAFIIASRTFKWE
ncbi:ABC transporter permease [Ferviditalea candida]|uniref:ABC transporter permease n=1 Tax=Ferviditalea candida TaxID=3108399 RepID=A0ABU5ZH52_9BACL|nr:ABC transporter permease [Paenibacillaceae bacterium T2]